MIQRVIFIAIGIVFFVAALHNPKRIATFGYSGLISLLALTGVAVAGRHIWIQHLPKTKCLLAVPGWNLCSRISLWPMSGKNWCMAPANAQPKAGRSSHSVFRSGLCYPTWCLARGLFYWCSDPKSNWVAATRKWLRCLCEYDTYFFVRTYVKLCVTVKLGFNQYHKHCI